tara:strand:- start:313 stop:1359 length:1047 start_codon:yes stop_codon:yes gene_type:complete
MSADVLTAPSHVDRRLPDVYLYGGLFTAAVVASLLARLAGQRLGPASEMIAVAGYATCGWSWLLVRALFQPAGARQPLWPLLLVLVLVATGAFLRLFGENSASLPRMAGNFATLVSSTLLLLAMIEPLKGLQWNGPKGERRFRLGFAAGYGSLLGISVIWVNGAPAGSLAGHWDVAITTACTLLAMAGMGFAVWYRLRHPLDATSPVRRRARPADTGDMAERLTRLIVDEAIFTRQNLKVADVARRLGEPEYRVTQCITGALGFRNFNQMANHYRIEDAKRLLADLGNDRLPILTIAYDCGFNSTGPFNRAFKAETGLTPKQFRRGSTTSAGAFVGVMTSDARLATSR